MYLTLGKACRRVLLSAEVENDPPSSVQTTMASSLSPILLGRLLLKLER